MAERPRPHVIGIDDGPFDRFRSTDTLVVGVVMAGSDRVEGVLSTRLPIDGDGATETLGEWVAASRFRPSLRAVFLEGITIAGLSVIDLSRLSFVVELPVIAITRDRPDPRALRHALATAGHPERVALVDAAGESLPHGDIHFACAGTSPEEARALLDSQRGHSRVPEAVRLAHLIAAGVT